MNIAELRVRVEAGRHAEHEIGGVKFQLRIPTDHAWNSAVDRNRSANGVVNETEAQRACVELGLVGWSGLQLKHFPPFDGDEKEVPFSQAVRGELLDARPDWQIEILMVLCDGMDRQRKAREEARKNS